MEYQLKGVPDGLWEWLARKDEEEGEEAILGPIFEEEHSFPGRDDERRWFPRRQWKIEKPIEIRAEKGGETVPSPQQEPKAMPDYLRHLDLYPEFDAGLDAQQRALVAEEKKKRSLAFFAKHLVYAADRIDSFLDSVQVRPQEGQDSLRKAAVYACAALRKVLETDYLRTAIKLLAGVRNRHLDDFRAALVEFDRFLEVEKRLLEAMGTSPRLIDEIVANCRRVIEDARKGELSRRGLFKALALVTRVTCEGASELKHGREAALNRRRQREMVKGASITAGGIALAMVNASVFAAGFVSSDFFSPGIAAASGAVGSAMVEVALQDIL